ncbi:hypothetical protein BXZ70DRAFT_578964 [Cristinia sonorae]|uniref:Uncharacterized protein n=1 Tax=Cristinia sonorae TaxID=1940300 RepID=A0A8K0XKJ9_9AGAR|nr:hypothetical protein BXZ70DRAFT_578964 [Cristinia sonorae]
MGHNVEKGFFSTNVDPSWQNLLEHLPDIRITLPVNSKPRRPRRLSEPEPPLPSDNDEVFPLPKSAPGVPIKSRTFASHRTTQSHDYDLRAGRSEFRRSPGNATSDRSLRRKPNLPEGMQVSRSISEATAALLSTPSTPRKQIGTTDTAARDRSNPLQRTRSEPRRLDGTSRRRVVHRKAVPKLELDDSNIISDASSSPARRRTDMKWGVHSVPRPVARYFDDSPIDKLFDPPSSAPAAASEEKGKRKEEVAHWRKEMQRKSEIYEQQVIEHTDEMPPLPIPIPPVHTASLTAREQVMHSIKTALDCDDFSELSLLKDDGAQLAVDTVWEVRMLRSDGWVC